MEDPEKLIDAFTEAISAGDAHKRWLVKADLLLKFYFKAKECAYQAEDIVNEIIRKTIDEGGRTWDMNKISIDVYMMKTIESEISNIVSKERNYETVDFNNNGFDERTSVIYNKHSTMRDAIEKQYDMDEFADKCLEILSDDTECGLVFLELQEGKYEKEIAESTGLTAKEVTAVKQRIRRKIRNKITSINT